MVFARMATTSVRLATILIAVSTRASILDDGTSKFDNYFVVEPYVNCKHDCVELNFETYKPFNGRVFVKNLPYEGNCSRNFASNVNKTKFSVVVRHDQCNMVVQRQRGRFETTVYSIVVIVSFHGSFITMADRAYRLVCVFKSPVTLTNFMEVSMLPTIALHNTFASPTCTYTIRHESINGILARFTSIGDLLYHVWQCDNDNYGLLVRDCFVDDGRGNKFQLLDEQGCSLDSLILPDVKYEFSQNLAFVDTSGFKFSKTTSLGFLCSIDLCEKSDGQCAGVTPPRCKKRKKRRTIAKVERKQKPRNSTERKQKSRNLTTYGFDLAYQIDVIDSAEAKKSKQTKSFSKKPIQAKTQQITKHWQVCISHMSFHFFVGVFTAFLFALIVMIYFLLYKRHKVPSRRY